MIDYNSHEPNPENSCDVAIWDLVFKDMQERDQHGQNQYGVRLGPFNGRDPLIDLYQELMDALVYLRQELYEKYGQ